VLLARAPLDVRRAQAQGEIEQHLVDAAEQRGPRGRQRGKRITTPQHAMAPAHVVELLGEAQAVGRLALERGEHQDDVDIGGGPQRPLRRAAEEDHRLQPVGEGPRGRP
jgi:hypothetical protein